MTKIKAYDMTCEDICTEIVVKLNIYVYQGYKKIVKQLRLIFVMRSYFYDFKYKELSHLSGLYKIISIRVYKCVFVFIGWDPINGKN